MVRDCVFSIRYGSVGGVQKSRLCWACPGWSFSLQRAQAPSTVETATLFGREHALEKKILRHDHAPW